MSELIQKYYLVEVVSTIIAQNSFYRMVIDYNDHTGKCIFVTKYIGFPNILYVMTNIEGEFLISKYEEIK